MGQVASALGLGSQFEFKGKSYTLSPWTYAIQGAFELYLADCAKRVMRDMKAYLTDAEYRDLVKDTHQEIVGGKYSFGQEIVIQAMATPSHMEYLVYLCLKPNHPEATPLLAKEIVADQMHEMLNKMAEANSDPNSQSPKEKETPSDAPSPSNVSLTSS